MKKFTLHTRRTGTGNLSGIEIGSSENLDIDLEGNCCIHARELRWEVGEGFDLYYWAHRT